jgi:hypothetical protein
MIISKPLKMLPKKDPENYLLKNYEGNMQFSHFYYGSSSLLAFIFFE